FRHSQSQTQINDWNALTADITQAKKIFWAMRDLESFLVVEDFADHLNGDRENFVSKRESHILCIACNFGHGIMHFRGSHYLPSLGRRWSCPMQNRELGFVDLRQSDRRLAVQQAFLWRKVGSALALASKLVLSRPEWNGHYGR